MTSVASRRPASAPRARTSMLDADDSMTYEDVLVAKYLNELRKPPINPRDTPAAIEQSSPYSQRLSNTHVVPVHGLGRYNRPQSATVGRRPMSATTNQRSGSAAGSKPRIDAKYIDDPDLWDPATPHDDRRRKRPFSAPLYKRPPSSAAYGRSRPTSAKSVSYTKKVRSLYKQQPETLVVTAFRNGSRELCARVTAPNLAMLLEACTDKLALPKAARRLYLEDGEEVMSEKDLSRDVEVYVSSGEPFKNPMKELMHTVTISQKSQWTMNGIVWPQDVRRKQRRTRMSKRFKSLLQQSLRRVLVFSNGSGSNSIEIVADPKKMEEFLTVCTAKLELSNCGRLIFDWEGNEVKELEKAPVLDECLQHGTTPVLGPLWISKGEGFSPKGVKEFLTGLIAYTQSKLKEAKRYQKQLQFGQNDDTKDKVEIVAILSMSEKEIDDALEIVGHDIDDYGNALNRLKEQLERIQEAADEEQVQGAKYAMRHIKNVEADEKMTGKQGIRLKVYENGSLEDKTIIYFNVQQAGRGIGNGPDREHIMMQRLLDTCASSTALAYPKKNPAIRPVPKKLFDKSGNTIKSVSQLSYDQEIWLSFGEPWRNPFMCVLSLQFDKVRAFKFDSPTVQQTETNGETKSSQSEVKVIREQLMADELKDLEPPRSSSWEAVKGLPDDFSVNTIRSLEERDTMMSMLESAEIDGTNSAFMRNKERPRLLLFGELTVGDKSRKSNKDWIGDAQLWTITKTGYICSKASPQLVLGLSQQKVSACLSHPVHGQTETHVEGFVVSVQAKQDCAAQQWTFTPDGNIQSQEQPDLLMTYLGSMDGDEEGQVKNDEPDARAGQRFYIAACSRMDGKHAKSQRWAIKQERFDNMGQWKHTQVENSEWNKQALSWPVLPDGAVNDKYDWPMEGYILAYAPPTKSSGSAGGENDGHGAGNDGSASGSGSLRLKVLKNGINDELKAVAVVAPPVKKSLNAENSKNHKKKHHRHRRVNDNQDGTAVQVDRQLHCDHNITVLKQQFTAFLDNCTILLCLPFSARRLFDKNGSEHFNLASLHRDDVVYVTCGEPWSDPKLSKSDQQRHFLLANLAADVAQIQHFVQLRNVTNLVLEVDADTGLRAGSQLIVNELPEPEPSEPINDDGAVNDFVSANKSAHELAHLKADERDPKLRWPWEKLVNSGADEDIDEANNARRPRRKLRESFADNSRTALERFVFEDGHIACESEKNLVLGVHEQESGHSLSVSLVRRRLEDIYQRWIINDNGLIQAKYNTQMVLTVSMKSRCQPQSPGGDTRTYAGCPVTLQRVKKTQFGRANQRWHHDTATGFIHAFHTDISDKEITAANVANVCTFAVMGETDIDQTGYEVEIPGEKGQEVKKIWTCSSCARAIRGRYRMKKLDNSVDFACAMGKAKELGIPQIGSFRCLNGKVDLSTHEAQHTLDTWYARLGKLRHEMAVRTIAKNISAAQVPYTVKVLAYQNGEGRRQPPQLIVGSSIQGILSQCSLRLKLTQAARRLYTSDGTMILNIEDLIDWARDSYCHEEKKRLRRESVDITNTKKNAVDGNEANTGSDSEELTAEQNDEKVNTSATELAQGTEFTVGDEMPCDRQMLDTVTNCVIIPDIPPIQSDGMLVSWGVFAKQPGTVALDVFRRNDDELDLFTLVGQTVFEVKDGGLGELLIDISSQPLNVQCGDVIGFHIIDDAVIPYDEDDSRMIPFIYQSLDSDEARGYTVKMDSNLEIARVYSLMANIVVADKNKKEGSETDLQTADNGHTTTSSNGKDTAGQSQQRVKVDPPSVEAVLHYPIEVFVSCGEPFVKPERVEQDNEARRQRRSQVAVVAYELYKEKHILRQMRGRRIEEHSPVTLCPNFDPVQPVLVEGGWQQPSTTETEKQSLVRHLKMELRKMKLLLQPKATRVCNTNTTRRLYAQPDMKRLIIFPTGGKIELAQYVWGDTLAQLLDNSTIRLNLQQPAKYLFTLDGRLVDDIRSLERDQIVCVAPNKKYLRPQESQRFIEIKANWVRACRGKGHRAGDVDAILFSADSESQNLQLTARVDAGHTHSIELKGNGFSCCPTCKHNCITPAEVPESARGGASGRGGASSRLD